MTENRITEQLTAAGRAIEHDSFAIIDREAGSHHYQEAQWPIVRRLIHANADFEFNGLTRFHPRAVEAGIDAILSGRGLVVDVEMIRVGLSASRMRHFGLQCRQFIDDPEVIERAKSENTTRAVQAMRKAAELGLLEGTIVGIGNAPTALLELIRLVEQRQLRPALVIGMPVGFVSAAESKERLMQIEQVPWISISGRKGGSTLVVATLHALMALAEQRQRQPN